MKNKVDMKKLDCMNYHVTDSEGEFWFAQNGLESLKVYAELSDWSFDDICQELDYIGQVTIKDLRSTELNILTLTMI